MEAFTHSFRAMDTDVDIVVQATVRPIDLFVSAQLLFERAEAKFSRFRPSSLLSRLNGGSPVVDEEFAAVCTLALEAWEVTCGAFNPMVLEALERAGYDRSFEHLDGGQPTRQRVPDPRECLAVDGDRVELRAGKLDLGGLVKSWAVDRCFELLGARLERLLVNAGGDLRCRSENGRRWETEIEGPDGVGLVWSGRVEGALATSSRARRRWRTASGEWAHHLIDPSTGTFAASRWVQVSARGPLAWRAEVWAKAVLIGGPEVAGRASVDGYDVLAVSAEGEIERFGWADGPGEVKGS